MILVDTSVLVDYLRVPSERIRTLLLGHHAAICGVTRAELLCGARTPDDLAKVTAALAGFHSLEIRESSWDTLGKNLWRLRSAGIAVPFQDALLATIAMIHDVEIWSRDAHFTMMRTVLVELRLFTEGSHSE